MLGNGNTCANNLVKVDTEQQNGWNTLHNSVGMHVYICRKYLHFFHISLIVGFEIGKYLYTII